MNLLKKIAVVGMSCALVSGGAVILVNSDVHLEFANAAVTCNHVGNHYTLRVPTTSATGTKEYWVCCSCHQHYTTKPTSGTWSDAGQAMSITTKTDDRYIAKISSTAKSGYTDSQGITYSKDGKSVSSYTAKNGITELVIPEGVTSIGTVFQGKKNITKVTLPDSVTVVGQGCFQNCTSLKTVTLGQNTTTIDTKYNPSGSTKYSSGAFQGCSAMQYLVIPASVTEIEAYTFRDCSKLKLYCEVASRPSGWTMNTPNTGDDWNVYSNSSSKPKCTTYWLGQWHYDANGVPQPGK